MSLKLSKNNSPAYDYLSEDGAMTNPAIAAATIDKTGGTVTSEVLTLYLVAEFTSEIGSYTGITITPSTAQAGLTWEMSLDDSTFTSSISPDDLADAGSMDDETTTVYARYTADNSETTPLATDNYSAEFAIEATENPQA